MAAYRMADEAITNDGCRTTQRSSTGFVHNPFGALRIPATDGCAIEQRIEERPYDAERFIQGASNGK
jgi:hypothetical protein